MLTEIRLKNFKCFREETAFPLAKINLLTGINGRGKSTLLQALLLMKQSMENQYFREFKMNGEVVKMGTFQEIKNKYVKTESIVFLFAWGERQLQLTHKKGGIDELCLLDKQKEIILKNKENSFVYQNSKRSTIIFDWKKPSASQMLADENFDLLKQHLQAFDSLDFSNIHYISADRIGAKQFHQVPSENIKLIDRNGMYAVYFLEKMIRENPSSSNLSFSEQFNQILSKIFDTKLEIHLKRLGSVIRLDFKIDDEKFLPTNVGFGFSYILSVLVATFMAKKGEILIIENPEAHLHEAAQHKLMRFLLQTAKEKEVQLFIETHSETIANALSVLVVKKELNTEDLHILHFEDHKPILVRLTSDGRRNKKPIHFFDQTEKDLNQILFG